MGVYIKGMEMPKKKYGYVLVIYPDGEVHCQDGEEYTAVPVPPHGDLVDRDKMREIAISLLDEAVTDQEANAIRYMWSHLRQMPVYIPAEPGEEETT